MKKALLLLGVLFLWACPNPTTGKTDPYLTARIVINQAQTAVALADGIFNQWLLGQADAVKAKESAAKYQKIKTGVANGLQLAYSGVDIAEQADEDPDIAKLLAQADTAWKDLSKLLGDLLGDGSVAVEVPGLATIPAPQPTNPDGGATSPPAIGKTTLAMTAAPNPLTALPKSLIPK